jgi:hypothetical protein
MESWNYTGKFLENFETARRSLIANMFCFAVRGGEKTPVDVIEWVRSDAGIRFAAATYDRNAEIGAAMETLLEIIETNEAIEYARFVIYRESLPQAEKSKLKQESGIDYAKTYMQTQPPSEKQLKYLKTLGCQTIPQNKAEASRLIDRYVKQKAGAA